MHNHRRSGPNPRPNPNSKKKPPNHSGRAFYERECAFIYSPRIYLTREETAEYLRLSPGILRDNPKHIPSYKFGGKVLYTREDLDGLVRPQSKGGNVKEKTSKPSREGVL
jgi:hypothetical protein